MLKIATILLGLLLVMSAPAADETGSHGSMLVPDPVLDQRTVVAPSAIPSMFAVACEIAGAQTEAA